MVITLVGVAHFRATQIRVGLPETFVQFWAQLRIGRSLYDHAGTLEIEEITP